MGEFLVISLSGRIEGLRVSDLSELIMRHIDNGENRVILDCRNLAALAASARRVFLAVARRLESRMGTFRIVGLRPALLSPIAELQGPLGPLPHHESLADALHRR